MTASSLGGHRRFIMALLRIIPALVVIGTLTGCDGPPPAPRMVDDQAFEAVGDYRIGPLDQLQIFVWQAPDLSVTVPVRPDGKITMPLVEDVSAAGKTASALARELEQQLRPYVREPSVSVVIEQFADYTPHTVRVMGEVNTPTSVAYRPGLTVLDVMTAADGLSEFAAGNSAKLMRGAGDQRTVYRLRLADLVEDGDVEANVPVLPGDVIVVPPSLL